MSLRPRELTLDTAFQTLFEDAMLTKYGAIPAIIRKINMVNGSLVSVDAQPAIQQFITSEDGQSNTTQSLPIIPEIPVVFPYGQKLKLSLTIPISIGDDCLLIFSDRSIDKWQQKGGIQAPVESTVPRTHDLTDAICIPGIMNATTSILDYKLDALEIRNSDRKVYIRLNDDTIVCENQEAKITLSSSSITLEAPTITINGDNLVVNSTTTRIDGTLIDKNGVVLETHTHIGNEGDPTSPPQN